MQSAFFRLTAPCLPLALFCLSVSFTPCCPLSLSVPLSPLPLSSFFAVVSLRLSLSRSVSRSVSRSCLSFCRLGASLLPETASHDRAVIPSTDDVGAVRAKAHSVEPRHVPRHSPVAGSQMCVCVCSVRVCVCVCVCVCMCPCDRSAWLIRFEGYEVFGVRLRIVIQRSPACWTRSTVES